jgi:hypothetical protein
MAADMQRLAEQAATAAVPGAARRAVVLLSSDKDFIRDVKRLTDAGHTVVVVHNAAPGSDHEAALAMYATAAIHVTDFMPGTTPPQQPQPHRAAPAAAPAAALAAAPHGATTILVEGQPTPVAALVPNHGVRYLLEHPGASGRWCRHSAAPGHDAALCTYMHLRAAPAAAAVAPPRFNAPVVAPAAAVPPPRAQTAAAAGEGFAVVDGRRFALSELHENRGLAFLRLRPDAVMHLCRNAGRPGHNVAECNFIHPKQA